MEKIREEFEKLLNLEKNEVLPRHKVLDSDWEVYDDEELQNRYEDFEMGYISGSKPQ